MPTVEQKRAYNRAYYWRNREALRAKGRVKDKKWYANNAEKKKAYARARHAANPIYFSEWQKKDRAARPEKYKERERRRTKRSFQEYYMTNKGRLREKGNAWRKANPDKRRAQRERYAAKHMEEIRTRDRERRDPVDARRRNLFRMYKMTVAEFDALVIGQGSVCAICHEEPQPDRSGRTGWHVDHCHDTGAVRGLLCSRCNTGLGKFRDNAEFLRAAADYLDDRILVQVAAC